MPYQDYLLIRSNKETDTKTGEPLFWSSNKGWVTIEHCDKFNNENVINIENSTTVNIKIALNDIYVFRRNEFINSLPSINQSNN